MLVTVVGSYKSSAYDDQQFTRNFMDGVQTSCTERYDQEDKTTHCSRVLQSLTSHRHSFTEDPLNQLLYRETLFEVIVVFLCSKPSLVDELEP